MPYDKFIESFVEEEAGRIYEEDIGLWLSLSADEKVKMIEETKEIGTEEDVAYLREAASIAKGVPAEEKDTFIKKYEGWKKGIKDKIAGAKEDIEGFKKNVSHVTGDIKSAYQGAREKAMDATLPAGEKISQGMEYTGKKLGIKALARKGAAGQDAIKAAKITRKLGGDVDTTEKVAGTVGAASQGIRKFASEHGGKTAAGIAAGLGAIGLVKALRRKKEQQASAEA